MPDYQKLQATAVRLITNAGRQMIFRRHSRTLVNTAKPWLGYTGTPEDLTLYAVAVPPGAVRQFGITSLAQGFEFDDNFKNVQLTLIIASDNNSLDNIDEVIDGGETYKPINLQEFKPADRILVAYMGIRR